MEITHFRTTVLPEKRQRGRPPIYPWRTMAVGDGFSVSQPPRLFSLIVNQAQSRYGIKLVYSYEPDGSARVTRVG